MKVLKKTIAVLASVALLASAAACSGTDKSWAAKDKDLTLPIGCYIYNLYNSYSEAQSKVSDASKPILEQKIENKDADTWIREQALQNTKELLLINRKMKEMNLSLTKEESDHITTVTENTWSAYQSTLEGYGIAKSSFNLSYSDFLMKYQKIFNTLYGKGGSKAVPDDELKQYFESNYTDFSYIVRPLYSTDENGSKKADFTDEEKKKAEKEFDDYASQIRDGKLTIDKAAETYSKSVGGNNPSAQSETLNLSTDTSYPDSFKSLVKNMKNGEIKAAELSDFSAYVLIQKNDIAKKTDEKLKDDSERSKILSALKGKEFSDEITKEAKALKDITLNDAAINSYNPSMFYKPSSSSTAAPASSSK